MAGEFAPGGFRGTILGAFASIGNFLRGFFGITARELIRLITHLKNGIVELANALATGVWRLGRELARALISFGRLVYRAVKPLALWVSRKITALEEFLKRKFKPILDFIKLVKDRIDLIYKRFIRPILDVIEFIRQLNRVLNVFHIGVLRKLDSVLGTIDNAIRDNYLRLRSRVVDAENWINRIVTLDGFFQRFTLLRSTWKYKTELIRQQLNGMVKPLPDIRKERTITPPAALDAPALGAAVRQAALDFDGELGPAVKEFVDQLRIYAHQG